MKYFGDEATEDQRFQEWYGLSFHAVWEFGKWLTWHGNDVLVWGRKCRPSMHDWKPYSDRGDIAAVYHLHDRTQNYVYEVKGFDTDFSCVADFPWSRILLDMHHRVEDSTLKIDAYVAVAKGLRYAAIVREDTRASWRKLDYRNKRRKVDCTAYFCPKHLADFVTLDYGKVTA